jgi:hypothetical protein
MPHVRVLRFVLTAAAVALSAVSAAAQTAQATRASLRGAAPGSCRLTIDVPALSAATPLEVLINKGRVLLDSAGPGARTFIFTLGGPLSAGDEVRVRIGSDSSDTTVPDGPALSQAESGCHLPKKKSQMDDESFDASGYLGGAVDSFAPNSVGGYQNLESIETQKTRFIAGINFSYRLLGAPDARVRLWLDGETVHGVRTADIDCSVTPTPVLCDPNGLPQGKFLFVLDHASSLEAFVSPRLEFLTLQPNSKTPARVYATARFGFMALKDAPTVFSVHHLGMGVVADAGAFNGSYVEVGWGNNELVYGSKWNRLKVDGYVVFDLMSGLRDRVQFWKNMGGATRFFLQIYVDNDINGSTADSVQTFFGMQFDLRQMFGR